MKRIAFCTTCKGRLQHVVDTLPKNLAENRRYGNAVFIMLNYNSHDELIPYLKANHSRDIESGRLVVYSFWDPGPFRMAHAKNMAHRLGILEGGEILVNMDADNFTGPDFSSYVAEHFTSPDEMFLCARMIKSGPGRLARGIAGRIVVSASSFVNAGGYNEKYNTWAPEDLDFNLRLRRMGYRAVEIDRSHLGGIPHHDRLRFREYPEARKYLDGEEDRIVNASTDTVVNFGKIGCGTVYRNFGVVPTELKPIPARIFGIGMHKTATTSFHRAMQLLGFNSAHWLRGDWARDIWNEMTTAGRSRTLERHYALSDLPIAILYEQLDKAYPNSKFVLTIRDEDKWVNSARKHWSYEHNPSRWEWDVYPFMNKMHNIVYGRRDFHEPTFRARYRKHNADVLAYFKNRPSDLFVLDMEQNPGWPALCRFLDQPVPPFVYPTEYVTKL